MRLPTGFTGFTGFTEFTGFTVVTALDANQVMIYFSETSISEDHAPGCSAACRHLIDSIIHSMPILQIKSQIKCTGLSLFSPPQITH